MPHSTAKGIEKNKQIKLGDDGLSIRANRRNTHAQETVRTFAQIFMRTRLCASERTQKREYGGACVQALQACMYVREVDDGDDDGDGQYTERLL